MLLLLHRRDGAANPGARVLPQSAACAGFARIRCSEAGRHLEVFHWLGSEGMVANRIFHLSQRDDGQPVVSAGGVPDGDMPPAIDESVVLLLGSALPADVALPAEWRIVTDLDALWVAVGQAAALTVILGFGRTLPLDLLMR